MFSNRNIFESILSVFSLAVGAVAIAFCPGPLVLVCGVVLFIMGVMGLIFGNW